MVEALIEALMLVGDVMPKSKQDAYRAAVERLRVQAEATLPKTIDRDVYRAAEVFTIEFEGVEHERHVGWGAIQKRLGLTEKTLQQYFTPSWHGTGDTFTRSLALDFAGSRRVVRATVRRDCSLPRGPKAGSRSKKAGVVPAPLPPGSEAHPLDDAIRPPGAPDGARF